MGDDSGGGGGGRESQAEKERKAAENARAAAQEAANRATERARAAAAADAARSAAGAANRTSSTAASENANVDRSGGSPADRAAQQGVKEAGHVSGPPTGETGKINVNVKRGSGVTATTGVNPNLSTAKQEEFVNPGSKFTGTTTPRPGYTRGMSPGDVNVITGKDLTSQQQANVAGTAGLNVDNFGNLQQRATTDVIQGNARLIPGATLINTMGKFTATKIRDKIADGGKQVLDTSGKIVGVVDKGAFGDVYTGASSYDPTVTGKKAGVTGYVMSSADVRATESAMGGGDRGDGGISQTSTASTATNVTGSTTTLSNAARRTALQGAAGGASRRQFI